MNNTTILHYSESLVKKAIFSFWWKLTGLRYVIAIIASFTFLFLLNPRSWPFSVMAAALFFWSLMAIILYVVHYRGTMKRFHAMSDQQAELSAEDETFTLKSAIGTSTFKWHIIQEIWQYPEFWLFFYSKAQFNIIPLADLEPQMQEFIQTKVRDAGGKIQRIK